MTAVALVLLGLAIIWIILRRAGASSRSRPAAAYCDPDERPDRVVFKDAQGREIRALDLRGATGKVDWEIIGARDVPLKAQHLHDEGRRAGSSGTYQAALVAFAEASRLAPAWPYPVYDAAFTYLLMGNAQKAEEYYARTVQLAPEGFFTALTAVDVLRREREKKLPKGIYLALVNLEWEKDEDRKRSILNEMVRQAPDFAPAWKELATLAENDDDRMAAIEKGLASHPDPETGGLLHLNRALVWRRHGKQEQAFQEVADLILDPHSTLGTRALARVTLAQWIGCTN